MKNLILGIMLIISAFPCFAQHSEKKALEEKAISIIHNLKEVKDLEVYNKKFNRTISYITDKETKTYVEISVGVNVIDEGRMQRTYFYKYLLNGKLYKLDIVNNKYKQIKNAL